jgi:UDP-3-O-[3-hydroxymyristoyl] glucosamine N-acyltransferase
LLPGLFKRLEEGFRMTIGELAVHLGGRLVGSGGSRRIVGVAPVERACEDEAAVVFGALPDSLGGAGLLVVGRHVGPPAGRPAIVVDEPRVALAQLTALFAMPMTTGAGIHATAVVGAGCSIDPSAFVGPLSVVEAGAVIGAGARLAAQVYVGRGVEVGAGCLVMPGVTLYPGTRLGAGVMVQAGARVGCDGFGYVTEAPDHPKVHSLGGVCLAEGVEIGANTTIERGTFDDSRVGRGTKIGDSCAIGHNTEIGKFCLLAGHLVVGGSVRMGDRVQVAIGVLVRDHVTVGDDSILMMGSHVVRDVPAGSTMLGSPAIPEQLHKARVRAVARLREAPDGAGPD